MYIQIAHKPIIIHQVIATVNLDIVAAGTYDNIYPVSVAGSVVSLGVFVGERVGWCVVVGSDLPLP